MVPSHFADLQPDETPRQRLIRWVKSMNGCSLSNRLTDLQGLVCRGVDDVSLGSWQWKTNCATSALGFLAAICGSVQAAGQCHPNLSKRSLIGTSMSWIMQIGYDLNAMVPYKGKSGPQPQPGDLLHYAILGTGDDHVEFLLGEPDPITGAAVTGGGGRPNNAITFGNGNAFASWSRPLQGFLNLDALDIPIVCSASLDVSPAAFSTLQSTVT